MSQPLTDLECWVLRHLSSQKKPTLNGELAQTSPRVQSLVESVLKAPFDKRGTLVEGFRLAQEQADDIARRMAALDPTVTPAGAHEPPKRCYATAADVRSVVSQTAWVWSGWIPVAIVGMGGFEGTGKTRTLLDIHRRQYHKLPMPDGSPCQMPGGQPVVWLCADGNHAELVETAGAFALPDDSMIFPTSPDEPFGGVDIDDDELMDTGGVLDQTIQAVKPWAVVVDTLTNATSKNLCDQSIMKALSAPMKRIVQQHGIPVILLLHLSRDGHALGRRIKGLTRTLLKLEDPDPENGDGRLRFNVDKSYAPKPEPLGVTLGETGNEYSSDAPRRPEATARPGRPNTAVTKAQDFIRSEAEGSEGRLWAELKAAAAGAGISPTTFTRAFNAMRDQGLIRTVGGTGTGAQMMVYLVDPDGE